MDNKPYPDKELPRGEERAVHALTERQREILQLVQDGKANKEVANQLGISEGTVKQHLVTIFRHLKVRNRTMAANLGILSQQQDTDALLAAAGPVATIHPESTEAMHYASAMQPVSMVVARVLATEALVHRLGSAHFGQLNRTLQQLCNQASQRFQGAMQAIPGGFLLLFGVPHMREDDPERAACCAFWVQRRMAHHPVADLVGEAIPLRLSVFSGEVVLSSDGGKTTLHGDIISRSFFSARTPAERACLLFDVCDSDALLDLSPSTRQALRLSGDRYGLPSAFFPEGDAILRAMGPPGADDAGTPAECGEIPFVGRDGEWRELRALAREAWQGASRAVVIVGEAGFGKTRLVRELRTALTAEPAWLWLEGHCRTVADLTPWYPFASVLETLSGCSVEGTMAAKAAHIHAWLLEHHPAHAETGRRLVALLTGAEQGAIDLEVWAPSVAALLLVILAAIRRPTVLFLDNLQWADPGTLAVFPHLAKGCNDSRLWLIGATRRSWLRAFPGAAVVSTLSLNRLTPKHTIQLLKALRCDGAGDEGLTRQMAHWSSGVPLFAVELGKMAQMRRERAAKGAVHTLPADHRALMTLFPRSLQGLILERLDTAQVDWRIVRAVAAYGQIALESLLVLGIHPRPATEAAVKHLLKVGLLGESNEGGSQVVFFNNEMVRAAVWLTLLEGDRRTQG
ncbi:MAG: AAA family ATPase [Magnetococcales bacterium]|nr:AAA family ATPase [Magnetococcales bacterium]